MDLTLLFAAITAAVILQAGILVAMYLAMRKSTARMETLAAEVKEKVLPAAETAHSMLLEMRPKVETILNNLSESTRMVRGQMERLDATVNDVIDRTRLQVIRADEMLGRTMDKIEETTEIVHKTVVSPVRQASGLVHALGVGIDAFFGGKRRQRESVSVPQDEMFI